MKTFVFKAKQRAFGSALRSPKRLRRNERRWHQISQLNDNVLAWNLRGFTIATIARVRFGGGLNFLGVFVSHLSFKVIAAFVLTMPLILNNLCAQTAFNATFDSAPASSCSTSEGCTDFTVNAGGDVFQFQFSGIDGGTMYWRGQGGEGNSPTMETRGLLFSFWNGEIVTIRRGLNLPFQFTSLYFRNSGQAVVTITPTYRGQAVGTAQTIPPSTSGTYTFGGVLVDQVNITALDFHDMFYDSFQGVIPANLLPEIDTSVGTTTLNEQTPTPVDGSLALRDLNNATLSSATVTISSGFSPSDDILAFINNGTSMGNITGSYNATTGTLSLTSAGGTATVLEWQSALRNVTYTNTSDHTTNTLRSITFVAYDQVIGSAPASKRVSVAAVNDAPVLSVPVQINTPRNMATPLNGISASDPDVSTGTITLALPAQGGSFSASTQAGVSQSYDSGTDTLSLTGTLPTINSYIAGNKLSYTPTNDGPLIFVMRVGLQDNGNSGSGGTKSDAEDITINATGLSSVAAWSLH